MGLPRPGSSNIVSQAGFRWGNTSVSAPACGRGTASVLGSRRHLGGHKAYGIGICSVEEIGSNPRPTEPPAQLVRFPAALESTPVNGDGHRLRDQIQLLIRKHRLDAALVKAYAADFCGTGELRNASREQVEKFVQHLSEYAEKDCCGLRCQLNSYLKSNPQADSQPRPNGCEVKPEARTQSETADAEKEAA